MKFSLIATNYNFGLENIYCQCFNCWAKYKTATQHSKQWQQILRGKFLVGRKKISTSTHALFLVPTITSHWWFLSVCTKWNSSCFNSRLTAPSTSSLWPSTPPNMATQTLVFRFHILKAWSRTCDNHVTGILITLQKLG